MISFLIWTKMPLLEFAEGIREKGIFFFLKALVIVRAQLQAATSLSSLYSVRWEESSDQGARLGGVERSTIGSSQARMQGGSDQTSKGVVVHARKAQSRLGLGTR